MIGLSTIDFQSIFESMISEYYGEKEKEDWIAIDGKSLKNTLTNYELQIPEYVKYGILV